MLVCALALGGGSSFVRRAYGIVTMVNVSFGIWGLFALHGEQQLSAIAAVVVASLSAAEIEASSDFGLAEAASASLGQAGFVIVGISAILATFSAINATLYGAARLSYTIAVEGELPRGFRLRPWHQPVGLHVTAVLGTVIAVALPLESISSLCSSVFLGVFTVVNVAAFRAGADAAVRRPIAACVAVASAGSLVVLISRNVTQDPTSLIVLGALVTIALIVEHGLFRRSGRTLALHTNR